MKLEHLKTFQHIAHSGSFTRTAQELFITQPTVSLHIQALEHELCVQLLIRNKQNSQVTPEGKRLLQVVDTIFQMLDEIQESFHNHDDRVGGELKLGASTVMGTYFLPPILARFVEKFPHVSLTVQYGNSYTIASWVQDGVVDFGFAPEAHGFPKLQCIPMHRERCLFAVGAHHPLAEQERLAPDDLKGIPFVVREKGTSIYAVTERWLRRQNWAEDKPPMVTFMDMDAIKKFVIHNVGITLLPEVALKNEVQQGILHLLKCEDQDLVISYALILRQNLMLSPLRRAFLSFLYGAQPSNTVLRDVVKSIRDRN